MVKILHTADTHLGRKFHEYSLEDEFKEFCAWLIQTAKDNEVDAVLISGDVYDRSTPPREMVDLLDTTLTELAKFTQVVLTSGNHDDPSRLGFASKLLRPNLSIRTRGEEAGNPVEVRGKDGSLALIYPIPYLDPVTYRSRLAPNGGRNENGELDESLYLEKSHTAVLGAALDLVRHNIDQGEHTGTNAAHIVMAHAFISGSEMSESNKHFTVGGAEQVPSSIFRLGAKSGSGPLAYVALGHLHSPQSVAQSDDPPMRYSGSPIAFSFSEQVAKSVVLLTVAEGKVEEELLPTPVLHPIVRLKGTLEDLTSGKYTEHRTSYVDLTVTDSTRPENLKHRLEQHFDYILHLDIRAEHTELSTTAQSLAGKTLDEIISEFVQYVSGDSITQEELNIFHATWNEIEQEENNQ